MGAIENAIVSFINTLFESTARLQQT